MPYAIWIIPPEPTYCYLQEKIEKLASEYGSPVFEPHLTLLSGINEDLQTVVEKVTTIANRQQPLPLSFGPVSFSTTYFQSVLVRVNSTAPLLQLHLDIVKTFNVDLGVFMPHMSLVYGNFPMSLREQIAEKIEINPPAFVAKELVIMSAESDPNEWKKLATIQLS